VHRAVTRYALGSHKGPAHSAGPFARAVLAEHFRPAGGRVLRAPQGCGVASRKSFTMGTMVELRSISVTWVVLGRMANRDAERGPMSP